MDGDGTHDEGRTGTSQRKTVEKTAWRWSQHVATTWYACTAKGSVQRNRMKPCGRLPCAAPLAANNLTHVLHGRGRTGLHDLGHASLRAQLRLTPSSGRNLLHALSRPPGRPTPPAVTTLHNCFQWHQFASQCSHVRSPAARPWPHRHSPSADTAAPSAGPRCNSPRGAHRAVLARASRARQRKRGERLCATRAAPERRPQHAVLCSARRPQRVVRRAGTSWQNLTHPPRLGRAAAGPPAACTPVAPVALPAAGLQPPAREATR